MMRPVQIPWPRLAAVLLLLGAVVGVYQPALTGGFVYDDGISVLKNTSIRRLWPISQPLSPRAELPTAGRPLVNLSLAFNYALGGLDPLGYHLFNLAVHLLNVLLVLSLARWTLLLWIEQRRTIGAGATLSPPPSAIDSATRDDATAFRLALAVALVWAVHPINVEAVAYITQRTELMVAFFYLLSLRLALKAWTARQHRMLWQGLVIASALAGVACKEVAVGIPLVIFLYDRCFVSGSFAAALRRSRLMYLLLPIVLVAVAMVVISGPRTMSTGLHLGLGPLEYLRAQAISLAWYLRLMLWPQGMRIMYFWGYAPTWQTALPAGIILLILLLLTLWALLRNRPAGFLGAWCFVILAPSSSFIPIVTEVTADRRMYLPAIALIGLALAGLWRLWDKLADQTLAALRPRRGAAMVAIVLAASLPLAWSARDYARMFRQPDSLWRHAIEYEPKNFFAMQNLAATLLTDGRPHEALLWASRSFVLQQTSYAANSIAGAYSSLGNLQRAEQASRTAVFFGPHHDAAWMTLGRILRDLGKFDPALAAFRRAAELDIFSADPSYNTGLTYLMMGRADRAVGLLARAVKIEPDNVVMRCTYANALAQSGQPDQAVEQFRIALKSDPQNPGANSDLGELLAQRGLLDEAVKYFAAAIRVSPPTASLHFNLGSTLLRMDQLQPAALQLAAACRLAPDHPQYLVALGDAYTKLKNADAAVAAYERALAIRNDHPMALLGVARVHLFTGLNSLAQNELNQLIALHGGDADVRNAVGVTLAQAGLFEPAAQQFEAALKLRPHDASAMENLRRARALLAGQEQPSATAPAP